MRDWNHFCSRTTESNPMQNVLHIHHSRVVRLLPTYNNTISAADATCFSTWPRRRYNIIIIIIQEWDYESSSILPSFHFHRTRSTHEVGQLKIRSSPSWGHSQYYKIQDANTHNQQQLAGTYSDSHNYHRSHGYLSGSDQKSIECKPKSSSQINPFTNKRYATVQHQLQQQ